MSVENTETQASRRPVAADSRLGLRVVGAMKLASGLALAAAGFGIFRLLNRDLGTALDRFVSRLHLDPENRIVHELLGRVAGLDHAQLRALGAGTLFYAAFHVVEGTGLILKRLWAAYLTVIASGALLPLELYEIARKLTVVRVIILIVNVLIVIYLALKLRHERALLRSR